MNQKQFFNNFNNQEFLQALDAFNQLDKTEQENILQQLYYQAREANTPNAISVLYRELHDGKTFDEFYDAWLPSKEFTNKMFMIGNKTYYHGFNTQIRVINAINIDNPKEIVSIGMMWGTQQQLEEMLSTAMNKDEENEMRHDKITKVAEKISAKFYEVKSDTNLGN